MAYGDTREGKWRENWRMQWSHYPSHYLGTRCIQHYYRWCAHLGCQQSTELTAPRRFKLTRPFRPKDEIWFLRACHHISTRLYYPTNFRTNSTSNKALISHRYNLSCSLTNVDGRGEASTNYWGPTVCRGAQRAPPCSLFFYLLSNIIICRPCQLSRLDQTQITLRMRVNLSDLL